MKNNISQLIDIEKLDALLEGFNKTTGFVTAILDLEGNVLFKSGWRQMCTEFHRINPEISRKCVISDTELANKMGQGKKFHFYKCLNGLIDVAVPIIIDGEHVANLFSGQFFFEEPDVSFFKKQAEKYGFDEEKYLAALKKVPVVSEEKVKTDMDFLLDMTLLISDLSIQKAAQVEMNKQISECKNKFESVFESANVGKSITLPTGEMYANQAFCDMLGYSREELRNKKWQDLTPEDEVLVIQAFLNPLLNGKTDSAKFEKRYICKNGTYIWADVNVSLQCDENGNPLHFITTIIDITENKQLKEALEKRILALTQPMDNSDGIGFDELFNIYDIQRLQDEFSLATNVASIITHPDGTPITKPSNFSRLCSKIIRKTEIGCAKCFKSDAALGQPNSEGPTVRPCLSGGLWDAGAAIHVGNQHIASWMIGQVRDEEQSEEKIREYAALIGADEDDAVAAFRELPSMSRQQFEQVAKTLYTLANLFSNTAYQNVKQARFITERKQAEEKEKELLKKFELIGLHLPGVIYQFRLRADGSFHFPYASHGISNIYGVKPEVVEQDAAEAFKAIHSDDLLRVSTSINHSAQTLTPWHDMYRVIQPTGKTIWVEGNSTPQKLEDGSIIWHGFIQDVTKRKLIEESLIKSEERFQLAMRASNDGLFDWNLITNEIYYSPSWKKMLGYEDHELPNDFSVWETTTSPEDVKRSWDLQQKLIAKQVDRFEKEIKMKHKNGHWVDILSRAEAIFNDNGKALRIVGTHTDITIRKQTEIALQETINQRDLLAKHVPGVLYQYRLRPDGSSHFPYASDGIMDIYGVTPEQVLHDATSVFKVLHPEDIGRVTETIQESARSLKAWYDTYRVNHPNGQTIWVEGESTPQAQDDGSILWHGYIRNITKRMQAEEQLRKLSQAVEQSPASVVITDTKGYIEYVNQKFTEVTGYTANEAIGQNPSILKSGEQSEAFYKELWETISSGKEWKGELHNKKKNGELYWESARISPITNEKGEILNYLAIKEDITKLMQAELNFRHSIDQSPLGIRIVSLKGETVYANQAFLNIFDFNSFDEYARTPAQKRYSVESYKEHLERKEIRKEGKEVADYEISIRQKNGKIKHVKVWRKEVIWNRTKHVQVINQDVTEQRNLYNELLIAKEKAEEREDRIKIQNQDILFNNERLESLLRVSQFQTESVQELLDFALKQAVDLTKSKIGYIYFYNEEKKQFILNSWSKEVMKECAVASPQTVYDLDKTGCWDEAVRQRKPIMINDYQAKNPIKKGIPEGHVKLEKFLTIPVIFDDRIVAVAGVGNKSTNYDDTDIRQLTLLMDSVWKMSERLILVKDLLSAKEKAEESDRLKSAFLANMSHEIRTPMNGILGFMELLQEPDLEEETKKAYIDIMSKSGQRLLNTINNIIEISKIDAQQVKINKDQFCIVTLLKELSDFFQAEAKAKGIKLHAKLPEHALVITSDRTMLESVFTNLIKNALKFTPTGEIVLGIEQSSSHLTAYVKDTGVGIDAEKVENLFQRFVQGSESNLTRKFEGSGLGLSITKEYVNLLNGKIWVESEVDKGSVFYVKFLKPEQID